MKKIFQKVLLPLFICLGFSLLFGEFAFRTISWVTNSSSYWAFKYQELRAESEDGETWSLHRPHLKESFYGHPFLTNTLGLRNSEVQKGPSRNILWLGSSVALGWGLPEEERLSSLLGSLWPTKNIVNAGVANHRGRDHFRTFQFLKEEVQPTHVILMFHRNDIYKSGESIPKGLQRSFLLAMLYNQLQGSVSQAPPVKDLESLLQLASFCRTEKIPFVILVVPDLEESSVPFSQVVQELKERGLPVFEVPLSALGDYQLSLKKLWLSPSDPHGNSTYQKLVAEYLLKSNFGQSSEKAVPDQSSQREKGPPPKGPPTAQSLANTSDRISKEL